WQNTQIPDGNIAEAIKIAALATPKSAYDPMDIAFQKLAKTVNMENLSQFKSISEIPLTKENLFYTHTWQESKSSEMLFAVKGAPEHIAKLCNFDSRQHQTFADKVKIEAARGYRAIGIAKSTDGQDYTFVGLALLSDPIRDGVPEAVAECSKAGIKTIMITGDHPSTAITIAKNIGLRNQKCITGAELDELNDV
ncbi:MAG: HAD-IC family P-type ATPase, partial [Actinomycetales bacterium]